MVFVKVILPDRLHDRPPLVTVRRAVRGYKTLALSASLTRAYKLKNGRPVLLVLDEKKNVLHLRFIEKHTRQTHRIATEGTNRSLVVRIKVRSASFLPTGVYAPEMGRERVALKLGEARQK